MIPTFMGFLRPVGGGPTPPPTTDVVVWLEVDYGVRKSSVQATDGQDMDQWLMPYGLTQTINVSSGLTGTAVFRDNEALPRLDFTRNAQPHYRVSTTPAIAAPTGPLTMYAVTRAARPSVGVVEIIWVTGTDSQLNVRGLLLTNSGYILIRGTGVTQAQIVNNSFTSGDKVLLTGVIDGTSASFLDIDGTPSTGTLGASSEAWGEFLIGNGAANTLGYSGDLYAFLVFNGVHDSSQRAAVQAYLTEKWM